jgi:L-lactate dehydrogenase complex protein LldG
MDSRQQILNRIREALKQPSRFAAEGVIDLPSPAAAGALSGPESGGYSLEANIRRFRKELEEVSGEFIEAHDENELVDAIVAVMRAASAEKAALSRGGMIERITDKLVKHGIQTVKADELHATARTRAVAEVKIGIVEATCAIADSATIAVTFTGNSTLPYFLPEIVVALVPARSLINSHFELFQTLSPEERRNLFLVTGPSRTADIEKILTLGAHGPRQLIVVLVHTDSNYPERRRS